MKKLQVQFTRSPTEAWPVGTLVEDQGRTFFEYAPDFLARGLNLSPFRLPFQAGLFEHTDRTFGPLPGLFDDSLPDGWGLLLMDRCFRRHHLNLKQITPLDRLAWLGTRTMGALTYHPPTDRADLAASPLSLHELARQSEQILAGASVDILPQLFRAGGSAGGARPKVLVGLCGQHLVSGEDQLSPGYTPWIVKFPTPGDLPNSGAVEYAYALMARAAGISMPPVQLFKTSEGERFFGVQRFDRDHNRRFHVHTFGNLIQSNFRIPSADYADLLKATLILTRNHQDVLEVFRRMVFNVLAHNRDDHVKNFAFIMNDTTGEWRLAPAYDLTLAQGPGGWHTMTIAGEGQNPRRSHILQLAQTSGISPNHAETIMEQVQTAVNQWPEYAAQTKVGKASKQQVASALLKLG